MLYALTYVENIPQQYRWLTLSVGQPANIVALVNVSRAPGAFTEPVPFAENRLRNRSPKPSPSPAHEKVRH